MSRFSFRDNVWSKWFPRFYHDHDTYRTEKLGGILERFVKICSEYFDDIMVDHTNEPGLDNIIELLDPDTTPELFMNYLWEFLGEIPYGYGLVVQNKEYNKDDITDWLRSDTYFRANSRKLLKYAISLYKIRGTQRFYQILGTFYYVQFTLIETENGGSPGEPLPLPTYDHLVIATFTQIDTQENVSYYPRGNGIQVRAGYPDGDCYSCLYYALIITVSSEEYDNWVSAGKVDVVKNTLVQIVERYLPVHCKLARYADNSLKVILEVEGLPVEHYTFAWGDYVCVQSELPYDSKVSFLESSGTQYIDTGLKPQENEVIEIRFKRVSGTSFSVYLGSRFGVGNTQCYIGQYNGNFVGSLGTTNSTPISVYDTQEHTISINTGTGLVSIDGGVGVNCGVFQNSNYNLYLFALNSNNVANNFASVQIMDVKIGQRAHFIPVRVGQIGCIYDEVSRALIYGSGNFIIGTDVG